MLSIPRWLSSIQIGHLLEATFLRSFVYFGVSFENPKFCILMSVEFAGDSCLTRDDTYFMHFIVFLVDGCLFKVPRINFELQSDVFQTMFTLPAGENNTREGGDESQPLRLEGVNQKEFRLLLKVLLGSPICPWKVPQLNQDEWISILKISHMWIFTEIRNLAIRELQSFDLDEVDKFVLARRYDISEWLGPACLTLVKRQRPLSADEFRLLGYEVSVHICAAREIVARGVNITKTSPCWKCNHYTCAEIRADADVESIVDDILQTIRAL